MDRSPSDHHAAGEAPRRLFFYNAGFLRQPRLRRILQLAGHDLQLGLPGPADGVVVWGRSPYAARGEAVAARRGVPLLRLEDAFLRSLRPGRAGDPPLGLMIDGLGVHFDTASPSRLETLLARDPLDDSNILQRARDGMSRMRALDLSKYNIHDPTAPLPAPGYVLVVDQTRGDAAIRHSGATAASFAEMLATARADHPRSTDRHLDASRNQQAAGAPAISALPIPMPAPPFWPIPSRRCSCWKVRSQSIPYRRSWGSRRSARATGPMSSASPSMRAGG
ncbi:MAG: hypothetical protein U5N10_02895 [Gemmobacter sp.]|nr:hypothetical protein [Gemmobacter sp.]